MPASRGSKAASRRNTTTVPPQQQVPDITQSQSASRPDSNAVPPEQANPTGGPLSPTSAANESLPQFERLNLTGHRRQLQKRSPAGTKGQRLTVSTNHFSINANQAPPKIYVWNVSIRKQVPDTRLGEAPNGVKRRVLELLLSQQEFQKCYSNYSDTLISWNPLTPSPSSSAKFSVDFFQPEEPGPRTGGRQVLYEVMVSPAAAPLLTQPLKDLLTNPSRYLERADEYEHVLNIMLLRKAGQDPLLSTAARGTKVFSLKQNDDTRRQLGFGLDMYRGYIRRIRILQGGLFLCLNSTAAVMLEETWADLLIQKWRPVEQPRDATHKFRQLENFLSKVKVQGMFGDIHRVKSIVGVVHDRGVLQPASAVTFHCDRHPMTGEAYHKTISVEDFFRLAYPTFRFRNRPDIVLKVGARDRPIMWPANACVVLPGQPYGKLLPFAEQSQQMIRHSVRDPKANIKLIEEEGFNMLGVSRPNPQAKAGNITASPLQVWMEMANAPARRLQPPTVHFLNGSMTPAESGKGQWNLRERKFWESGEIVRYTVLVLRKKNERSISNISQFTSMLGNEIARYCNQPQSAIQWTRLNGVPQEHIYPAVDEVAWLKRLFEACLKQNVRYCYIIPSDSKWYSQIKTACDSVGMHSTISLRKKDGTVKASPGEIANLLLKTNLKLGGINWSLNMNEFKILQGRTCMFAGADVIHPPPGAKKHAPSVAAVVASTSPTPGQFPGTIALQHHPDETKKAVEMILVLDAMFASRLELWAQKNNGDLPELIFFYRDGVSDSQLEQVLDQELPLLEKACKVVYGKYGKCLPLLCLLNSQKRHIVRFYGPANDRTGAFDQRGNPLPGLVVDTKICSKDPDDWYAVSHKCIQGTSRPAHHYRVYDQIDCDMDDLQQLTYALAYIYGRSVTSISIPAPARLADRLCERAKYRMMDVFFPGPGCSEQIYNPATAEFKGQSSVHPSLRDTMYYI